MDSQRSAFGGAHRALIQQSESNGLAISIISCWEVAKLVENGRLQLPYPVGEWLRIALAYPGMQLVDLSLPIVVTSTQLPGNFHRDPANQMIVATAITHQYPLLTVDAKILAYPHVPLAKLS
ncbi:MAG: type II toxin-antitoxin system VapC family toxin [Caldilineaceae bacterium]